MRRGQMSSATSHGGWVFFLVGLWWQVKPETVIVKVVAYSVLVIGLVVAVCGTLRTLSSPHG